MTRARSVLLAASLVILALVASALAVYVFPSQETPQKADVIYVIGPVLPWRLKLATRLVEEGVSDDVLISIPAGGGHVVECSEGIAGARVTCRHPQPSTTQGEARDLAEYLRAERLTSALVITSTPHIARTRLRMEACVPDGVSVIGRSTGLSAGDWLYQIGYQTAAFVKLAFTNYC